MHIRVRRGDDDSDDDSDDADTFDDARRPSLEFVRGKRRAFISSERSKTPLFLLSKSRFFVEDLNKTSSEEEEEDATVFSRLRLNERTIALTRLVDLANGEEEEKEERAGEEKEKEEEEKKKKSERTGQKKTKRKKSKDGLGGPNWSGG